MSSSTPQGNENASFHRGVFTDELEHAKHDLADATPIESHNESPSVSSESSVPTLSPTQSATPSTPLSEPVSPPGDLVADGFAFAFDIDGVLIRGGRAIPEAVEAMKVLNGQNEYGMKIPYIFLTNGGGKSEEERCKDLSKQMEIDISPAQFICGHTPMSEMATKYGTVLVVGGEGEKCRQVAESYGFTDVVTPGDIIKHNSATTPFRKLTPEELANSRERDFSNVTIDAVFVFADSRDWAGDLQIILDVAMSKGGRLGTTSETFDEGPPIYFSHSDVLWSAAHNDPRLGMGALRGIVEYTFKEVTKGKTLTTHAFGKPQIGTFEFATRLLRRWRKNEHNLDSPPETVYFVGDTPESDIRGTNQYNAQAENDWYSILVRTGIYQEGTEPAYKPRNTVNSVLDAVNFGIKREMEKKHAKNTLPLEAFNKANKPRLTDLPNWLLDNSDCAVLSPAQERALDIAA
ncbi:HAD-like domain-containing protein [Pestalotiopsis sp. NC0098]|nr:HAD-like domain-containing protein [Pestalotiopsis sp. NC0098]KAI4593407.1 hypothetical protein KJ359_009297 [Pestalotiopsis sp. 9143b]